MFIKCYVLFYFLRVFLSLRRCDVTPFDADSLRKLATGGCGGGTPNPTGHYGLKPPGVQGASSPLSWGRGGREVPLYRSAEAVPLPRGAGGAEPPALKI